MTLKLQIVFFLITLLFFTFLTAIGSLSSGKRENNLRVSEEYYSFLQLNGEYSTAGLGNEDTSLEDINHKHVHIDTNSNHHHGSESLAAHHGIYEHDGVQHLHGRHSHLEETSCAVKTSCMAP